MQCEQFAKYLSAKQRKRRIIEAVICVAFLALFIVCCNLREATKEVIVHEGGYFFPGWEDVNYNNAYVPFIVVGMMGAVTGGIFLLSDFIACGFRTIQKDGQYLTVYRGMLHNTVYVDGIEKGRMGPFSYTNVVEVWLANRVRVTISFGRTIWYIAHISFSDDTSSIEV